MATRCPFCRLPVIIDRAEDGPALRNASASAYVRGGRCPYPECGSTVFAAAVGLVDPEDRAAVDPEDRAAVDPDDRALEAMVLFSPAEARWVRLRGALEAVAPLLFAWSMTFGILAVALWAAVRGLSDEDGGLAIGLVLGGPAMVVVSICTFVAVAATCSAPRSQSTLGLSLRPVPRSYRSV